MRIGFIGAGRMGGPIARNLANAGHEVLVYDAYPAALAALSDCAGISAAASAAATAAEAGIVFTSLPGPREVEQVALGEASLIEVMQPGAVYVDLSTNSPTVVRRIAAAFAERSIPMLDAPVSGGVDGATTATLSIMVGGDKDAFERLRPVFEAIGSRIFYCGAVGNGSVAKLCNNICSAANAIILSESLTLGVRAGVDLETLASVIGASTGSSSRLVNRFPKYLFQRNFEPGFSAALSFKDTSLALELADEYGVPMAMASRVREEMLEVLARGWADLDFDVIARLQEERTGIVLETKP